MDTQYGPLNGHSVGTLMKEAVRRAIEAIRGHRFTFEATAKGRRADGKHTFVTTADHAAQRVFVKLLREWFPTYGIVAEEGELSVPCTHPKHDLWFTVDPLDGTRAFMRRQSHGIGTMISLVRDGEVVGACVGDVMTQEVYSARPDGRSVHRVSEFGIAERLYILEGRTLADQWLLLRERPHNHSTLVRSMVDNEASPLFAAVESSGGGSIGIAMARLWKGEVGGAILGPIPRATPWDFYPIMALCARLGFDFWAIEGTRVWRWLPEVDKAGTPVPHEVLVIHRSRAPELEAWLARSFPVEPP
ncbi:MAG: hypothetical protein KC635_03760 [Myxococcales bacterium]|nr:hypothetical protein [Myxococcales bacterium]MCB9737497.1 hypothetical protein [Deltaproteobacteria bacterium]